MRLVWILALSVVAACGADETGSLRLRILEDGREVPARVEVLDDLGAAFAASCPRRVFPGGR